MRDWCFYMIHVVLVLPFVIDDDVFPSRSRYLSKSLDIIISNTHNSNTEKTSRTRSWIWMGQDGGYVTSHRLETSGLANNIKNHQQVKDTKDKVLDDRIQ
mgnify:CR=1 FL=1